MSHAMYVSILFPTIVFLELLILCLFFEKIYRFDAGDRSGGGEGRDHSFFFLTGKVANYLKWRLEHRERGESSGECSYSEEMKAFLTANSDIHSELLGNLLLLISGIIIFGAFFTVLVVNPDMFLVKVFFLIVGFSLFLGWWKEHRKFVIDFLVCLEKFLAEFEQQKSAEQKREKANGKADTGGVELLTFIKTSKNILTAITVAVGTSIFLFRKIVILLQGKNGRINLYNFFDYKVLMQISLYGLLGFAFSMVVSYILSDWSGKSFLKDIRDCLDHYRKKREDKAIEKEIAKSIRELVICPELAAWEQEIRQMCRILKIKRALFVVTDQRGLNAEAAMAEEKLPVIVCSERFLNMLSEKLGDMSSPAVRFLLGHELAHVYYKDIRDSAGLLRIWGVSFFLNVGAVIGVYQTKNYLLLVAVSCAVLFCAFFPLRLWMDERCRKQIMELRADRIGMQVSNTPVEVICALFDLFKSIDKEENKNFLYQYYKGYVDVSEHISAEKRKREIMRGKKWCITEYARYMFCIQINLILFKGWKL